MVIPLLVALAAAACGDARPPQSQAAEGKPLVVASIFPVGDLARFLGGDDVRVEVLLPARASPSTFEPTARQMALLSGAAGYVFVGGGMDRWAERLVAARGRRRASPRGDAAPGGARARRRSPNRQPARVARPHPGA